MSGELRDLYQEMILDHGKHPRNHGPLSDATAHATGHNPLCGDRITVHVKESADGTLDAVRFEGCGCAISVASASMMTETVEGQTRAAARECFERFHRFLAGSAAPDTEGMGKLVVFAGVREFPMRVKCATLAWHTFLAALEGRQQAVSTE